jgi:glutaredoxin
MTPKSFRILILLAALLSFSIGLFAASDGPDVLVFYRAGCHECEQMEAVLAEIQTEHPQLDIRYIEEADPDAGLMWSLAAKAGVVPTSFPVIFVGDVVTVGASRENELKLRTAIDGCLANGCASPLPPEQENPFPWRAVLIGVLIVATLLILFLA